MTIVLDGTSGITSPNETTGVLTATSINASGAITAASVTTTGATGSLNSINTFGFKNRIINGNMAIDQRNAGANVTPTSGQYTLDRWITYQSVASKYSVQQNAGAVTPPVGFSNYLGITSLSAYSILTGDYYIIRQFIEGFNFADMAWGTASAAAVTLSFKVYSSLTGTFGGSLANYAQNRNYPFTYSIPVANTWTTISITIAGDTTGTWVGSTNGCGLQLNFGLGVGATYSGTAGSWSGGNYFSATGATSVVGTSGATFYITGVQLEKGSVATSFDQRAYSQELAMCQRYYYQLTCPQASTQQFGSAGQAIGANAANGISVIYPVTMRATATLTTSTVGNFILQPPGGGSYTVTAISYTYASIYQASLTITVTGGAFSGGQCTWMYTATLGAYLGFSAEL